MGSGKGGWAPRSANLGTVTTFIRRHIMINLKTSLQKISIALSIHILGTSLPVPEDRFSLRFIFFDLTASPPNIMSASDSEQELVGGSHPAEIVEMDSINKDVVDQGMEDINRGDDEEAAVSTEQENREPAQNELDDMVSL